jgi:hypothetical protein
VFIETGIEGAPTILRLPIPCQGDQEHVPGLAIRPHGRRQLISVQPRQPDIDECHFWLPVADLVQAFRAISCHRNVVSVRVQKQPKTFSGILLTSVDTSKPAIRGRNKSGHRAGAQA